MSTSIVSDDGFVVIDRIERMRPFLVSVVSASDHWLYVSSNGGLSAGRVDPDSCLFPYRTDDQLHLAHTHTGPYTAFWVGETFWEPFVAHAQRGVSRRLAKSVAGDRLRFEETHSELGLTYCYEWSFSERFGLVRRASLRRHEGFGALHISGIDGLRSLVPAGAAQSATQTVSCLIDAYTRAEHLGPAGLTTITMETALSDRAEPAESLRATTVWSVGLEGATTTLDPHAATAFMHRDAVPVAEQMLGRAGAFLNTFTLELAPGAEHEWAVVADVQRSQADVVALRETLGAGGLLAALDKERDAMTAALDALIDDVDGLQLSGDRVLDAHHRSNALFNAMRGGVLDDETRLMWGDWATFVAERDRRVAREQEAWLTSRSPETKIERRTLFEEARALGDASLERLAYEYLPIWFGRRHGDPSRPWNRFAIRVKNEDGDRRLTYQGNWRDIFQNWEALLLAHPRWVTSVIAKFVNASTRDGYNPYRITREGIDWEKPEPDNPFSNLGYWGDHQIIYLTKLLELAEDHEPGAVAALLQRRVFSYADVPYRLRSHADLVKDPRDAVVFDHAADAAAEARVEQHGAVGNFVHNDEGEIVLVNLAEKLLVPVLAKLSAFVPGGGIWMNTQRPEWNDANNALAGYGLSVVTTAYLHRHLGNLIDLFGGQTELELSADVGACLRDIHSALGSADMDAATASPRRRKALMDALGVAGERFRERLDASPARIESVSADVIVSALERARTWLAGTLKANRRDDGLYHGYNLVRFEEGEAHVERLYEMLEGQVALLSAGLLDAAEARDLLERLFASALFEPKRDTFLLYPFRKLPSFLEKGVIAPGSEAEAALASVKGLASIVEEDAHGVLRFAAGLSTRRDLERELDEAGIGADVSARIVEAYEQTFGHLEFTGRSGGMYGYEGIGCTYWHMNAKLLLAAFEVYADAAAKGSDEAPALAALYHRVREGMGFRKSPQHFGAFPTDAYSHTPAERGAQQPGMTGLVKEELLTRRGELGIFVDDGQLRFEPSLLLEDEWRRAPATWSRPGGEVSLPADSMAFTCCGVPVVYVRGSEQARLEVRMRDGSSRTIGGSALGAELSGRVFDRDGSLAEIRVHVPR